MERSLALDIDYFGVAEPGDGVPGTVFTQFPTIDSVTFNFSEPKEISFTAMGREDPWAVVSKKGDPSSIEITIPSPTAKEMETFCGGTATGDKWEAPVSTPTILKTIKLQSSPYNGKYTEYVLVKTSVAGRLSQAPGKEQSDLLLVKATIMAAVSAKGDKMTPYTRIVKPVVENTPEQASVQSTDAPAGDPVDAPVDTPADPPMVDPEASDETIGGQ